MAAALGSRASDKDGGVGAILRRHSLRAGVGGLVAAFVGQPASARERSFDVAALKPGYTRRIAAVRASGRLPIFDIESSYNPARLDLPAFAAAMDREGIAVMALSADQPGDLVDKGQCWSDDGFRLVGAYPDRFLPVGNGGNHPAWTRSPDRFLDDNERHIVEDRYPLMGEFEFRHYPSPRQVERQETWRDVKIPLDGPQGHRLFAFAARTGIPFQIHYEIEDQLLPALDTMLSSYPAARVIWCHLAQIRWASQAKTYDAAYLRGLLARHPNLYIDTAFGGPNSIYPTSRERHGRVWTDNGDIGADWKALIQDMPWRFLAALDIGGDRQTPSHLEQWTANLRRFLDRLPAGTREIVAYKAAWKLLFGETIDG